MPSELERVRKDADSLGIPLKIVRIEDSRVAVLYQRSLALIRPDQHVAWRGDAWPGPALPALVCGSTADGSHQIRARELGAASR